MMLNLPNIIEFSEYAYSEPPVSGNVSKRSRDSVDSKDLKSKFSRVRKRKFR